jgi:molecular chaperone GrpE
MDAQGEIFDPNLHEAISQEAHPEYEDGQIIEVIKQGYLLGDRVIRPALVRVAA